MRIRFMFQMIIVTYYCQYGGMCFPIHDQLINKAIPKVVSNRI